MKNKISLICCILVATLLGSFGCRSYDNGGEADMAKITINLSDSSNKNRMGSVISSDRVGSAMILALPESFQSKVHDIDDFGASKGYFTKAKADAYDKQMLDLTTNTVTLSVPLNTPVRFAKITYKENLTLSQVSVSSFDTGAGLSDPVTFSSYTDDKTVEIEMMPLDKVTVYVYQATAPWVAYQVGDGSWQKATLTASSDGFTHSMSFYTNSDKKYGVAVNCSSSSTRLEVEQFLSSQLPTRKYSCKESGTYSSSAFSGISGTITGLVGSYSSTTQAGTVYDSSAVGIFNNSNYSISNIYNGTISLISKELEFKGSNSEGNNYWIPQRLYVERDISLSSDLTNHGVNFDEGSKTLAVVKNTLSVKNETDYSEWKFYIDLQTKDLSSGDEIIRNGSNRIFQIEKADTTASYAAEMAYWALDGNTTNTDYYTIHSETKKATNASNNEYVKKEINQQTTNASNPGALEIDHSIINTLTGVTATASGKNYLTYTGFSSYTPSSSSPSVFVHTFEQEDTGNGSEVYADVSKDWLGSATSYTIPDLSGLDGWNISLNFSSENNIDWQVSIGMIEWFDHIDRDMPYYQKMEKTTHNSAMTGRILGTNN